jgi:putative ATP-dependent endonuclease of the OLD family
VIDSALKGLKGKEIGDTLMRLYPEVADADSAAALTTQKDAKVLISEYIGQLPKDAFKEDDIPLPTGIDNSIRALLPEPVYIPAVKDLSDDLKTKESTSFGKLLKILLNVIESDLTEAADTFDSLRRKLTRIRGDDGSVVDERMTKVRDIEQAIQSNLEETFRDVSIELEIPPPEIRSVLSNASIVADDGVRGPVEDKGDGFKRAITFSILRSYVQLSQSSDWQSESNAKAATDERFLFLFEEPELYLHPRAQNILFDALALIAERHQVVVTTHSPLFFSADQTTTFIKMAKRRNEDHQRAFGKSVPIDLTDLAEKDKFQIISFETSNLAFFSDKIILVEGDSELIVLPHVAKLLNDGWDFKTTSTSLVKVNGKGSFQRYREFFERFSVGIYLVTDLDILIQDFDKITPSQRAVELRSELLQDVDRVIEEANALQDPPMKLLKEELQRERTQRIYERLQDARAKGDVEGQINALEEFFAFERSKPRLEVLRDHSHVDVLRKKRELLAELRSSGVFVLEKGAIESYYPEEVRGGDKPSKAQSFCSIVTTCDRARQLCDSIEVAGNPASEFDVIMEGIFGGV